MTLEILSEYGDRTQTTLDIFVANNDGLPDAELESVKALKKGECVTIGGGASVMFFVTRL